jgi:hypothetical protein
MIDARFVPLEKWPLEPTRSRQESRFRATYGETLSLLETELRHLYAKEITIQAFFRRDQIRNDGWPYANANPSGPGIILSFTCRGKALSFPCDRFNSLDCNLRAIALSLEALRAVDRYGVTRRAEQYQGWARLEAPRNQAFASKEDAAAFVVSQAGSEVEPGLIRMVQHDGATRKAAYRAAAARLHPDANPHGDELFKRLQQAMEMLAA